MANTQTTVPLFVANAVLTAAQQNISAATGVPVFATNGNGVVIVALYPNLTRLW